MTEKFKKAAEFILSGLNYKPTVGIVLGSGLGGLADVIVADKIIQYKDIVGFPISTVEGHKGQLILGTLGGKKVVAMQGRFHYYEGYSMDQVTFPIRVMKFLGVETLVVSNAAGGLNPDYATGDIMVINDHINNFPHNPLIGKNIDELGVRFPDMSKTYDRELINRAHQIAANNGFKLQEGVYVGSSGPTLETPAEYRMLRLLGADTTGMSTVPEVIVAHHQGMRVFGLSVVTNGSKPADPNGETTHEEVQNVANSVAPKLTVLITKIIESL
ncbi:MAG: purine-nucleoside phosphorylase [Salinivirgaceae bacterium]|nr:purine-nucleoside phosphorylase [Salinivirgaceae bacterium]